MTKLQQLALKRNGILCQLDASHKLIDAALMMGTADVEHLQRHAHNLLTEYHTVTREYTAEMFNTIRGGK
jgi:hypothetical protein